jgi:uncharacterized protein YciI
MRVALIAQDNPDSLQIRLDNRDVHLAYIAETGVVEIAGPFLDLDGQMCGSMIIMNVDSIAAAQTWAANDPYEKARLFKHVSIQEWKKVIG